MSTLNTLQEGSSGPTHRNGSEPMSARQQLLGMLVVIIALLLAIVLRSL